MNIHVSINVACLSMLLALLYKRRLLLLLLLPACFVQLSTVFPLCIIDE
jgi:hypothetical protein